MAVGGGLFGCAADVDCAEDRAILIVEDGNIRRRVAEDVEVVIVSIVEVAVRIALHVDLLENRKGLRIEHRDRL